ncbi:MAG: FAD/NAD(P)-binding oxidoreductase [Woeseiaceae bacterium]|nr:FAD/NAD(P)-binding oxidoreductase [Woeseiaceae bacterium]
MDNHQVVVVGAGPAGIQCAETLVLAGIRPILIDEGQRCGGQIYRQQPENFERSKSDLYGTEADKADDVHKSFEAIRDKIEYLSETTVWNVAKEKLFTVCGTTQKTIPYDSLIICTGAIDRLMPVKGWDLSGTYSLGGAQIALKSQACSIGHEVVFMGSGPLLYLVAAQYIKAGATVKAVLDTSSYFNRIKALPKLLARPSVLWNGVLLNKDIMKAGVPIKTGITPIEFEGSNETGVQTVRFKTQFGNDKLVQCDAVAVGYHLRPETQIADLARCQFQFDKTTRQWLLQRDADGRASRSGVYLAGDGSAIMGADAAELAGKRVAMTVLEDIGQNVSKTEKNKLSHEIGIQARFANGLAQAFPWPANQAKNLTDDTIVCRCEVVSAGDLRRIVRETGAQEVNRAKAFSRIGMGRCQGRYCGHVAAEIIASEASVPIKDVGRIRTQAPIKPLTIAIEDNNE